MGNWSKKFSKVLTAAGISAIVAFSSLVMPIEASAARTVTDNVMIRNDASTEAGIIGSLNEGDEVQILDVLQSADGYAWYYIQLDNGATGYVRSDLIEADDSELAAFRDKGQEETQTQEEPEEAAEPEETNEPEETAETEEAAPAEPEAAPAQDGAGGNAGGEGYDATKDPNANFRAGYEQEADGTVTWYVYNDDNGSKVKISDLQSQENSTETSKGGPGIWRTLAIVFGILVLALAAFVLFLLKSIREGRSKTTRGRALEAAAAARDLDEEEEEEEFFFEDDEPSENEIEPEETDAQEKSESDDTQEQNDGDADEAADPEPAEDKIETADSTITIEVPDEAEPAEIPAEEIEAAIAATTAQIEENISKDDSVKAEESSDEASEEEEFIEEESEEAAEEPDEEDGYEDDYEDEDYEEEDYEEDEEDAESEEFDDEDEDYEDEDYDEDDEESESRAARRSAVKGGFFGFLKKMFGSESDEDAEDPDDGGDFDDYDEETEEHEFDEFKEYPEDIDLLPREEEDDSDYLEEDEYSDEDAGEEDGERGRLSMQRVMKNVSYKEDESDFYREGDPNDLSDSLFEDDDDMEYSFISNRKK